MHIRNLHSWELRPKEAIALQNRLASKIRLIKPTRRFRTVAGADIAMGKDVGVAAVIVFSYPDLIEVETAVVKKTINYPYIPGLLSFREAPVLLDAFEKLKNAPDVAIFDGQGIAHPRRLGLASHMGLWLQIPTIGCAKSRLTGIYQMPGKKRGNRTPLEVHLKGPKKEVVGTCLRTRDDVKPVFISPGHLIDLKTAVEVVLACFDKTRIPKPTRDADRLVGQLARELVDRE